MVSQEIPSTTKLLRSYVRRSSRMSRAQKRLYESGHTCLLPDKVGKLELQTFFPQPGPLVVEIGFGMGSATAQIAEANPHINYLGVEVHKPGIGKLLWEIDKRHLTNLRIIEADAVDFIQNGLAEMTVEAFHLFFPDPWPKKRHHKRRLVQRPFTQLLASRLKSGGYLYFVTDWSDYGDWALSELRMTAGLVNAFDGFAPPQSWRPKTEFEVKGLAKNHLIHELLFRRLARDSL